jgi:flagellar biosynthesis/type III secretory pathway M-ring protein FliF/YscJ
MKQTASARKGEDQGAALARSLLAAIVLLIVPHDLVREGRIAMTKSATAAETQKPVPQATTPPARDPQIAVAEEYQIARQQGTAQALELFVQRHPDDPLAEKARADLRRMSR